MTLPNKITPCPIEEAIIEIRFMSKMPPDAIFGVIYQQFKAIFPKLDQLPILQIPEPIRLQDPVLLYKPYYKLSNETFALSIGPKILALSNTREYVGWSVLSEEIKRCLEQMSNLEIIEKVIRLGIRYINFFDGDIFDRINLGIILGEKPLVSDSIVMRGTLKTGNFISNLRISNRTKLEQKKVLKEGSVIDIDTFLEKETTIKEMLDKLLEEAHLEEKKLFFSLLRPEFLKQLNPE